MKKLLLFISAFTIISCSESPEDKMQNNIKSYVDANANDPSSYEPVETIFSDTMYVRDFVDSSKEYAQKGIEKSNEEIIKYEKQIKEDEAEIANGEFESVNKIRQEGIDVKKRYIELEKEEILKFENKIPKLDSINNLDDIAFIRVVHRARLKNGLGALTLSDLVFVVDENLNIEHKLKKDENWFLMADKLFEEEYLK